MCRVAVVFAVFVAFGSTTAHACPPLPYGTEGYWVSSFSTQEILRFDEGGTYVGATTIPNLSGPRGIVAMPNGEVYVSSQINDQIHRVDLNGAYLGSFQHGTLDGPTGASVGPSGDYYVCSFNTDSILRFDSTLTLVDTYTSPGLSGPNCIVFRPDGEFFVTGQFSNDVHHFSSTGTPIGSFATRQSSVMGAAFDLQGRLLTAAGSSDEIKVWTCDGVFVDEWPLVGGPQSIAVREDGLVYVTTFYTDRVVIFDANGNELGDWTGGNVLRGMEFLPAAPPTFVRGDANGDGAVALADPILVLAYLFSGGSLTCLDAADANDDGQLDIGDPIRTLSYLFAGGTTPPAPSPGFPADADPTADTLGCLD